MTDPGTETPPRRRGLFELVASIPELVRELVHREIELVKTELTEKLKALGAGAGLVGGAVVVLGFVLGVLLTAAILGLSLVMPGWLAALIVAGVLLIVAAVLALIGVRILRRGIPPVPTEALDSIQRDIKAIKGIGKRGTS